QKSNTTRVMVPELVAVDHVLFTRFMVTSTPDDGAAITLRIDDDFAGSWPFRDFGQSLSAATRAATTGAGSRAGSSRARSWWAPAQWATSSRPPAIRIRSAPSSGWRR